MGLDILDQVQRANGQTAQAGYLAQVARNQQEMQQRLAGLQEQQARRIEQDGAAREDRQRLATADAIGRQRASLAAQGGDITRGSAPDLLGDTARAGTLEALGIRDDMRERAFNARLGAMLAENRAGLAGAESANQWRRAGAAGDRLALDISRSLLGGAASLFSTVPL